MKKIFTKSLAVLASTAILTPSVLANTGSTLENNATSAADTQNVTPKITYDNTLFWKTIHCQILKDGFVWAEPISLFINHNTCNGIINTIPTPVKNLPSITQLLNQTSNTGEKTDTQKMYSFENFSKFHSELIQWSFQRPQNKEEMELHFVTLAKIFENANIPENWKMLELLPIIQNSASALKVNITELGTLAKKHQFTLLDNFLEKSKHLKDTDIAYVDFDVIDDTILITENKNRTLLSPKIFNKKGEIIPVSDVRFAINTTAGTVEVKNNMIIFESPNSQENTSETIQISVISRDNQKIEKTLTTKYVKSHEVEERIVKATDTRIPLPNETFWLVDSGLIEKDTPVKILAGVQGWFVYYQVVFADNTAKIFAKNTPTVTMGSGFNMDRKTWKHFDFFNKYYILKHFYTK